MQITKQEIQDITVYVVSFPSHTGYFFEWNGAFVSEVLKVSQKNLSAADMTQIQEMVKAKLSELKSLKPLDNGKRRRKVVARI